MVGFVSESTAREIWVDAKVKASGGGTKEAPFKTIAEAMRAAKDEDTVLLCSGTYPESVVITRSGTKSSPFTLRSAPGETACISGFGKVSGWEKYRDSIYTTTVDWPARDLYLDFKPQVFATLPKREQTWFHVGEVDGMRLKADDASDLPELKTKSAFIIFSHWNFFQPITEYDAKTKLIVTGNKIGDAKKLKPGDRFVVANDPNLITRPGDWAYEPLADEKTRLYYWPRSESDLARMQSRRMKEPALTVRDAHNVRIEGIEIAGTRNGGIHIETSQDVTVAGCIVHDNVLSRKTPKVPKNVATAGIDVLGSSDVSITRCLIARNWTGVYLQNSSRVAVDENEICFNIQDAFLLEGARKNPVPGSKPGYGAPLTSDAEISSENIRVSRNYIHHHLGIGDPAIRGKCVRHFQFEDNLVEFIMFELQFFETDDFRFTGNVMTGCPVYDFLGVETTRWSGANNTILFSRWGIGLGEGAADFSNNIVYGTTCGGKGIASASGNLLWPAERNDQVRPGFTVQNPSLTNVPQFQVQVVCQDQGTPSRLVVCEHGRPPETSGFSVGDYIEVNGDGRLRRVTQVDKSAITIDPPLPVLPWVEGFTMIWNWKKCSDFQLDARPASNKSATQAKGPQIGAMLDIPAYRRGEFEGRGKRLVPKVPEMLRAAWPDPDDPITPFFGIP